METCDVCIVGGGPAGLIAAHLLALRGVNVLVLEKNRDFSREYRGEVLMPRFVQMFRQIHLDTWLDSLPHLKLKEGEILFGKKRIGAFDFSRAVPEVPYALWLSQPVLLEALDKLASRSPNYHRWFGASAKKLMKEGGRVVGVVASREGQEIEIRSRVVIGADGRFSTVFRDGGFEIEYEDYRFDVLWFTIEKPAEYDNTFRVLLSLKRTFLLLPKYPDAIQVGIFAAPHELAKLKQKGIGSLREEIRAASPLFEQFAESLHDFTAFHPLQAHLHNVKEWAKDGCLLIGDSAHCCSPAGAIGVSIATGTAIVAADVIAEALQNTKGVLPAETLLMVQRRREADVRQIHRLQMAITGGFLGKWIPIRVLLPTLLTLLGRTRIFARMQRKLMGMRGALPISKATTALFLLFWVHHVHAGATYDDIKPIIDAKCATCHRGPFLNLTEYPFLWDKSDDELAVAKGLLERVYVEGDKKMPPVNGTPLTCAEKLLLSQWLDTIAATTR